MLQPQWLKALRSLGLELWLPLPLLGLIFWVGGGLVTDQILSSSYATKSQLQIDTRTRRQPVKKVVSIEVEIKRHQGFSKVNVEMANSALKELEFQFPVTNFSQVEAAIANELGLSLDQIRRLVRYEVSLFNPPLMGNTTPNSSREFDG